MLWLFNRNGSSPLSRGILQHLIRPPSTRRIIPALAGNTGTTPLDAWDGQDHPRSRGEYPGRYRSRRLEVGSSPLSRGIQFEGAGDPVHTRIIPALAGNTRGSMLSGRFFQDHPRSRGEYATSKPAPAFVSGSSPLSRGIR